MSRDCLSGPHCCAGEMDPDCTFLWKFLTNEAGNAFNGTDWSNDAGMGDLTIEGVDHITIADATLTPQFTMDDNEAYSVVVKVRGWSGSTPRIKIKMGANTIDVDLGAETCKINSVATRTIPTLDVDQWITIHAYFCPTHSMGEVAGPILTSAHIGYPAGVYGATTLDSADPAVTQSWSIEIIGTAEVKEAWYIPSDVVYDGAMLQRDCGRFALFPCQWDHYKNVDPTPDESDITNVDLALSGADVDDNVNWPGTWTPHWAARSSRSDVDQYNSDNIPADQSYLGVCTQILMRHGYEYNSEFDNYTSYPFTTTDAFGEYMLTFAVGLQFSVRREEPSAAEPYPEAYARAQLNMSDNILCSFVSNRSPPGTSTGIDLDLVDVGSSFTIAHTYERPAADSFGCDTSDDTVLTWNHPA